MNNVYAITKAHPEFWIIKKKVDFLRIMEVPDESIYQQVGNATGIPVKRLRGWLNEKPAKVTSKKFTRDWALADYLTQNKVNKIKVTGRGLSPDWVIPNDLA